MVIIYWHVSTKPFIAPTATTHLANNRSFVLPLSPCLHHHTPGTAAMKFAASANYAIRLSQLTGRQACRTNRETGTRPNVNIV